MGVEFNEPTFSSSREGGSGKKSSFEQFIINTGIVRTETGARFILVVVALVMLALAGFLFIDSGSVPPPPNPADYPVWPH